MESMQNNNDVLKFLLEKAGLKLEDLNKIKLSLGETSSLGEKESGRHMTGTVPGFDGNIDIELIWNNDLSGFPSVMNSKEGLKFKDDGTESFRVGKAVIGDKILARKDALEIVQKYFPIAAFQEKNPEKTTK